MYAVHMVYLMNYRMYTNHVMYAVHIVYLMVYIVYTNHVMYAVNMVYLMNYVLCTNHTILHMWQFNSYNNIHKQSCCES